MVLMDNFPEYSRWANLLLYKTIDERGSERERSILIHIITADNVWAERVIGRPNNPILKYMWEELPVHLNDTYRLWRHIIDTIPADTDVVYKTSIGQEYCTTVHDILSHVMLHEAFHRGQITEAARSSGLDFPETDYVLYVRETAMANSHHTSLSRGKE